MATATLALVCAGGVGATVVQQGTLRITVLSQVAPYRLPRVGTAPISVFVAGHLASTDGGIPPQLQKMDIKVNRHGVLQSVGLPVCPVERIKTASTTQALRLCASALIGSGRFWAHIVLPDQVPYPTHGRLLIFNGREGSKPLLLAHIFTSSPFPSSFVIAFAIRHIGTGKFGTELIATLPQALGNWGYVDRIKLNLKRRYRYRGRQLSYFNAGCPAPQGTDRVAFPLALSTFYFEGRSPVKVLVPKSCGVKG
ncbi:MAG: hypothetical protein ACTHN3_07360 [Solirubrobacterales bacterium]